MQVLLVFFVVLIVSTTALFAALMLSRQARIAVERRVALVKRLYRPHGDSTAFPKIVNAPSVEYAAEQLRRVLTFGLSQTWGMRASALTLILLALASGGAGWAIAALLLHFGTLVSASAGAAAFFFVPRFVLLHQEAHTETQFLTLFPDAIDMVVRMLRAGLPITAAIKAIGNEAPPPVNGIFKTISDQTEIGIPFDEALAATGQKIGITDFRFFATAVALQRATGGNLATTLEILGDIIRKRRAVRLKAQATTAEVRVSAYILGAMPFLVIGALLLLQPGYLMPLFQDPRGKILIGIAAGLLTAGFLTMRQMMRSATRL